MQILPNDEMPPDVAGDYVAFSDLRDDVNQYEIHCGECGKIYYTDEDNRLKWSRAIEQALDNPFLCDTCQSAEDELAYREH